MTDLASLSIFHSRQTDEDSGLGSKEVTPRDEDFTWTHDKMDTINANEICHSSQSEDISSLFDGFNAAAVTMIVEENLSKVDREKNEGKEDVRVEKEIHENEEDIGAEKDNLKQEKGSNADQENLVHDSNDNDSSDEKETHGIGSVEKQNHEVEKGKKTEEMMFSDSKVDSTKDVQVSIPNNEITPTSFNLEHDKRLKDIVSSSSEDELPDIITQPGQPTEPDLIIKPLEMIQNTITKADEGIKGTKKSLTKKQMEKRKQEIMSNHQKSIRSSKVRLPYHQPKQCTLEEFLKKRSNSSSSTLKNSKTTKNIEKENKILSKLNLKELPKIKPSAPNRMGNIVFDEKSKHPEFQWRVTLPLPFRLKQSKKQTNDNDKECNASGSNPHTVTEQDQEKSKDIGREEMKAEANTKEPDTEIAKLLKPETKAQNKSPEPGEKLCKLKRNLRDHIRKKKVEVYEKKLAEHKKSMEEKKLKQLKDYKDELPEDEELADDEFESESESDEFEDEEEALEYLLSCKAKKRRPKHAYVDDEAEDDDDDGESDEENDDSEVSEYEFEELKKDIILENENVVNQSSMNGVDSPSATLEPIHDVENTDIEKEKLVTDLSQSSSKKLDNDGTQEPNSFPGNSGSHASEVSQKSNENWRSQDIFSENTPSFPCTPEISTAVLQKKTPRDFWVPTTEGASRAPRLTNFSPLIPKLNLSVSPNISSFSNVSDSQIGNKDNVVNSSHKLPTSEASVGSKEDSQELLNLCSGKFTSQEILSLSETQCSSFKDGVVEGSQDLISICSGKFPSQQPSFPDETQCNFFNNGDDDAKDSQELLDLCSGGSPSQEIQPLDETQGNSFNEAEKTTSCEESRLTPSVRDTSANESIASNRANKDTPKSSERSECRIKKLSKTKLNFTESETDTNDGDNVGKVMQNISSDDDEFDDSVLSWKKKRKRVSRLSDCEEDANDAQEKSDGDSAENEDLLDLDEVDDKPSINAFSIFDKNNWKSKSKSKQILDKHGKIRKEFVEAEAELSGSDVGSEDEDERGLNNLEIEEGDQEEFDEEELLNQVNQIRLKQMLDADQREIQHLQDALFEDGDLRVDGEIRQRKFRWRNMNLSLFDERAQFGDSDDEVVGENEEELQRKLDEIEKKKWKTENSQALDDMEESSQSMLFENSQFLKLKKSALKKIHSFNSDSFPTPGVSKHVSFSSVEKKASSSLSFSCQFSKSVSFSAANSDAKALNDEARVESIQEITCLRQSVSQPLFASPDEPISKIRKGSFLSRGKLALAKIAEKVGPPETVSNVNNNSRNFVFSSLSPSEDKSKPKSRIGVKTKASEDINERKKVAKLEENPKRKTSIFNFL